MHMHMSLHVQVGACERATVRVEVHCQDTRFGDTVALTGAAEEVGGWNPARALRLDGSCWPKWRGEIELSRDAASEGLPWNLELKAIILRSSGGVSWENFTGNRTLELQVGPAGSDDEPFAPHIAFVFGDAGDLRSRARVPAARPAVPTPPSPTDLHRSPAVSPLSPLSPSATCRNLAPLLQLSPAQLQGPVLVSVEPPMPAVPLLPLPPPARIDPRLLALPGPQLCGRQTWTGSAIRQALSAAISSSAPCSSSNMPLPHPRPRSRSLCLPRIQESDEESSGILCHCPTTPPPRTAPAFTFDL